ncbi:MAG TPA: UvrB/UvrC motif-containing protein [Fimbriiglobus sp.]|nr:UvrB/UvrC motif-containing protein [Fimbriiglobus sp.]
MKCHYCGQPATVHLTDIVAKQKRELHLCEGCAREHHLVPDGPTPQLNLQALVQLIMGMPVGADPAGLTCPTCGLKYAAFRADGRLGCPDDYDAFRSALEPLLDRIHRGTRHQGKTPRAAGRRAELDSLRDQLQAAVATEKYEDAARLRDRIRQKEALG